MSYEKRNDVPVAEGETAVELSPSGDLVAVSCTRKRVDQGVSYHAIARAVNADGTARTYPDGRLLQTAMKHGVPVGMVDQLTDDAITRECLLAVLGEPTQGLFAWADVNLSAWSIRISIAAAAVSGAADAGAVL